MLKFGNESCCKKTSFPMLVGFAVPVLLSAVMVGCGGSTPTKTAQQAAPEQSVAKPAAKPERPAVAGHGEKAESKKKEGGIPYDAFFDEPLTVVKDNAVVAGTAPAKDVGAAAEMPADKPAPAASGGGAFAWNDMLPADELQAEAKKILNRLKGTFQQGMGSYNGNYKDISVDGAVIAALAGVAIESTGEVKWKVNAPFIRDFGHELSESATGLGKENFEKSKLAYEKLEAIFSGTVPADAKKPAPSRPFHETAGREGLMKRIDKAKNWMRDNINTEAKLKAESEAIVHEAIMISTLGKIVSTEGYSSADEQDYQQFATALINGAKDAATATRDQSFQKFTDSMNKVNKSCEQCHANYGNN